MQRICKQTEITQTAESRMIQVAYADNKVFTNPPTCDYQNVST
jgi:hypothetical protein